MCIVPIVHLFVYLKCSFLCSPFVLYEVWKYNFFKQNRFQISNVFAPLTVITCIHLFCCTTAVESILYCRATCNLQTFYVGHQLQQITRTMLFSSKRNGLLLLVFRFNSLRNWCFLGPISTVTDNLITRKWMGVTYHKGQIRGAFWRHAWINRSDLSVDKSKRN